MPLLAIARHCACCEQLTYECVTFLGSTLIVHVPCCANCQASMGEDHRFCLLVAAYERRQALEQAGGPTVH